MARKPKWKDIAPQAIYNGYPESDLFPIEPPELDERIESFKARAEEAGDTLFLFLCREADDEIDAYEYSPDWIGRFATSNRFASP